MGIDMGGLRFWIMFSFTFSRFLFPFFFVLDLEFCVVDGLGSVSCVSVEVIFSCIRIVRCVLNLPPSVLIAL